MDLHYYDYYSEQQQVHECYGCELTCSTAINETNCQDLSLACIGSVCYIHCIDYDSCNNLNLTINEQATVMLYKNKKFLFLLI